MIKHNDYNKFVQAIKLVDPYEQTFLKQLFMVNT